MSKWVSVVSRHRFLTTVLFLMGLIYVKPTSSQRCSPESVNACVSYFRRPMISFNISSITLDDVIPSWNRTVLTALCQGFYSYSTCMKLLHNACSTAHQLYYTGIDNAWRYLCQSPYDEFANFSSCFVQNSIRNKVDECNATLAMRLSATHQYNSYDNAVENYCSDQDAFVSCVSNATRQVCGDAAGDWDDKFVQQLLEPMLSYLSCPGWGNSTDDQAGSSSSRLVIVMLISIAAFVIVIIMIVILIMVLARKRTLERRSIASGTSLFPGEVPVNINDPPSYCEPYVVYEPTSSIEASNGDSTTEGCIQFRRRFVDPLTGQRHDGGLVKEADLPYKVCPSLPPLYAYEPPPSFDETFPSEHEAIATEQRVPPGDFAAVLEIDNEAFCDNDEITTSRTLSESRSERTAEPVVEIADCSTHL